MLRIVRRAFPVYVLPCRTHSGRCLTLKENSTILLLPGSECRRCFDVEGFAFCRKFLLEDGRIACSPESALSRAVEEAQ